MHFLERAARTLGRPNVSTFSAETLERLQTSSWPGNVRELQNCVEYAVALTRGAEVRPESLPSSMTFETPRTRAPAGTDTGIESSSTQPIDDGAAFPTLEQVELAHIERALVSAAGHRRKAADLLGIDPKTLYRKLLRREVARTVADGRDNDLVDDPAD